MITFKINYSDSNYDRKFINIDANNKREAVERFWISVKDAEVIWSMYHGDLCVGMFD